MPEYPIVSEDVQGNLIIDIDGVLKLCVARREREGRDSLPILLDGSLLPDGRLQVSCIKYRWPDGYEKWGHYLGSVHPLEHVLS